MHFHVLCIFSKNVNKCEKYQATYWPKSQTQIDEWLWTAAQQTFSFWITFIPRSPRRHCARIDQMLNLAGKVHSGVAAHNHFDMATVYIQHILDDYHAFSIWPRLRSGMINHIKPRWKSQIISNLSTFHWNNSVAQPAICCSPVMVMRNVSAQ